MALKFPKMSCPNGTLDVAIDLTDALEDSETVATGATCKSDHSTILSASNVQANTVVIEESGRSDIAVGKGIQMQLATTTATEYDSTSSFPATGSTGTYYYVYATGVLYEWDATSLEYSEVDVPSKVTLYLQFSGNSGTALRYEIDVPIKYPALDK